MAHLDKLKISRRVLKPRPPRQGKPSVEHYREKLIANLEEQIELARNIDVGKAAVLMRRRGSKIREVHPRLWWHADPDGHVGTYIFHNRTALTLDGGSRTIEVGPLSKLPSVYKTVIAATRAGELDAALQATVHRNEANWKA